MRVNINVIVLSLICFIGFSSTSYAFFNAEGTISLPLNEIASNDLTLEVTVYRVGEPIEFINPFISYDEFSETVIIGNGENSTIFSVPFDIVFGVGYTYGISIYCSNCQTYYAGRYTLQGDGSTSVTEPNGAIDILDSTSIPRLQSTSLLDPINFFLVPQAGDIDEDTILNSTDNCILSANSDQKDTDTDGIGNICDVDDDNDTILDADDNCSLLMNAEQTDLNDNGVGDACELLQEVVEEFCFPVKASNKSVATICL